MHANFIRLHELLCFQSLYDSIKRDPFKIPEDDGNDLTTTFFNPDKEGWLLKQGKLYYYNIYYSFQQSIKASCTFLVNIGY